MEKPFACNMCNFRAARLGNLTVHLRTHTGEKPFPCHLCGYSANHSSNLKSHIRNIHDKTIPYQKR
jgi:KRAB domain-containing zinc finger protein